MALLADREARAWDDGDGDEARHWLTQQEAARSSRRMLQFCHRVMAGRHSPLARWPTPKPL
jgi:hypothetical protein